jgi:hypothetical protein
LGSKVRELDPAFPVSGGPDESGGSKEGISSSIPLAILLGELFLGRQLAGALNRELSPTRFVLLLPKEDLIFGAVMAFAATSAFAQTSVSSEYYVVRDATTKKCTIVDKKPTTTTTTRR